MIALVLSLLISNVVYAGSDELTRKLDRIEASAFGPGAGDDARAAVQDLDHWLRQGVLDYANGETTPAAGALFGAGHDDLPAALTLLVRVAALGSTPRLRQHAHNACTAAEIMLNGVRGDPQVDRVGEALRSAIDNVTSCRRVLLQARPPERHQ